MFARESELIEFPYLLGRVSKYSQNASIGRLHNVMICFITNKFGREVRSDVCRSSSGKCKTAATAAQTAASISCATWASVSTAATSASTSPSRTSAPCWSICERRLSNSTSSTSRSAPVTRCQQQEEAAMLLLNASKLCLRQQKDRPDPGKPGAYSVSLSLCQ